MIFTKALEGLSTKAKNLKKEITAIYYAYQNPKLPRLPKFIIIFTLCYALSPIDLIPDFIPILGYLDDLLIIPVLISLSIKLIPKEIMEESRRKAKSETVILKRNWLFAVIFILLWITLLSLIILAIVNLLTQ